MDTENYESRDHISGGYVLLARKIQDGPLWHWPPKYQRLWLYLLTSARWDSKPTRKGDVEIGRGQWLRSYEKIALDCEWIENNTTERWHKEEVRRMLRRFEKAEMVDLGVTGLGTLITIRNFNKYQAPERYQVGACDGAVRRQCDYIKKEKNLPSHPPQILDVFEYWETAREEAIGKTSGPPMQPTKKRLSKINARLAEGYSVEQLKEAVDGCLSNCWNIEGGHTDIELICRDQAHVERYRAWHQNGPPDPVEPARSEGVERYQSW